MSATVRDGRTPPFWYVTHDATAAILEEFPKGDLRKDALAVYGILAAIASSRRGRGLTDDGFEASRSELADQAGVSTSTLDKVKTRMERIGVLRVTTGHGAPNCWTLLDPSIDTPAAPEPAPLAGPPEAPIEGGDRGTVTLEEGRVTVGRSGGDRGTVTQVAVERSPLPYTRADEVKKKEEKGEREARARAICSEIEQHVTSDLRGGVDLDSPGWMGAATALLEHDGHDPDEVLELARFAVSHPFWRSRIVSVKALRSHIGAVATTRRGDAPPSRRDGGGRARPRSDAGACCIANGSPPMAAEDDWAKLAPVLRKALGASAFDVWLGQAHAHSGPEGELLIAVPACHFERVNTRYRLSISRALKRTVQIVTCEETTP